MSLEICVNNSFERRYKKEFERLAAEHGLATRYEEDLAALDGGVHLTTKAAQGNGETVSDIRVWYQLKGKMSSTLSLHEFEDSQYVVLNLQIDHLRQWYRSPEPVYLVVYIECVGIFLAEDVRTLVDRVWGDRLLNPSTFKPGQGSVSVRVSKNAVVDEAFWQRLQNHMGVRIDGRSYKGNPLIHNRDLTDTLRIMDPYVYTELVQMLLSEHDYRIEGALDGMALLPAGVETGDSISLTYGKLFNLYEWIPYLARELIEDENGFRAEGRAERVQGPCAVLIQSQAETCLDIPALQGLIVKLAGMGIKRLLVFINHHLNDMGGEKGYGCFHTYLQGMGTSGVRCWPQYLEDLSLTLLTSMNLYLKFRDKVTWWSDFTTDKIRRGEWKILGD
jgi:Domain of unknown function (DUF4365)